jgi:4-alpha-glucanotransferase
VAVNNLPPVPSTLPCTLPRRRAGVLLHPSSLPGGDELGDGELGELGSEAFRFVEFLAAANIGVWQVLPLGPTHADLSPYMSPSAHAGNPRLISLQRLREWGWLADNVLTSGEPQHRRHGLLQAAHSGFETHASAADQQALQDFCDKHQFWLDDYALYQALRQAHYGRPWVDWPIALRDRQLQALHEAANTLADAVAQARFEQFVFFRQWAEIKQYANERDIELLGDMPIFVAHDSAEVWAQRDYFSLDDQGQPLTVAGVPPDYFSETGQRWGNPHYRWARMAEDGYQWWVARLRTALELFDRVRIDHFRGFEAYWEIPASAETAIDGHWVPGPGDDFFNALLREFHCAMNTPEVDLGYKVNVSEGNRQGEFPRRGKGGPPGQEGALGCKVNASEGSREGNLGCLPLVAEDLGVITPAVEALRDRYGLPGMKILQFAFGGGADNPYLPHHHQRNAVVYTGTHDNDTTLGWYRALDGDVQHYVRRYLGDTDNDDADMPWALIRAALASPARLAIIPLQDLLELGGEARMNTPAQTEGNWRWRFQWSQVPTDLAGRLKDLVQLYGR